MTKTPDFKKLKATPEQMAKLHSALVDALIKRIQDGTASAADLAVAAKMMKDNGISTLIDPAPPETPLTDSTPVDEGDDFDEIARTYQ